MQYEPLSPNIVVKVPKLDEQSMREKKGNLYLHPNFVWMTRNTQCGEIVAISTEAHTQLPEAGVGDILLFHHFVQRSHSLKGDNDKFLIDEDEDYRFYNVNTKEWRGNNNNTYGVWNGTEIIPHKDYVLLEKPEENTEGWHEPNEKIYERMEQMKVDIQNLASNKMTDELLKVLQAKELELQKMTIALQKKEYRKYRIAFSNPSLCIPKGSWIYALNIACMTEFLFLDKKYTVAESRYVAAQ